MPSVPPVFMVIQSECDHAVVVQAVKMRCSVTKCEDAPTHMVSLAMSDGKRNVYAFCERHLKVLMDLEERIDPHYEGQAAFYYNGCGGRV